MPDRLPIEQVLERIVDASVEHGGAVVEAPPGAGKTTRVPVALAERFARLGAAGSARQVVVLEPRRLAARAAARRVADELGVPVGGERVGYRVRFDNRARADTAVVFVTPGVLLRWIQDDVALEGVRCLVFDEFHERGLDSDLALALGQHLREELREDLALVVMSATLEGERLARHLQVPQVVSEGRMYPVTVEHRDRVDDRPLPVRVAAAVRARMAATEHAGPGGALLVFLPGVGEIRRVAELLAEPASEFGWEVTELFGAQGLEQQERALRGPRRRVVLSTNLAESSVTVEGVTTVIDSGVHKLLRFDAARGVDRLVTEPIPMHSAEQRRGRAGRLEPGHCVRLWTRAEETLRRREADAEITRVDLSSAVLQTARLGLRLGELPWLQAPSAGRIAVAEEMLVRIGALRDGPLTEVGDRLARLPVAPRLGRLLLAGVRHGVLQEAAWTAALLSERDPLARGRREQRDGLAAVSSDLEERFEILRRRKRRGERGGGWSTIERVADQLERQVVRMLPDAAGHENETDPDALGRALAEALPDRVALAVVGGADEGSARGWRARMVGGLGILPGRSRVRHGGLMVVLDIALSGSSGRLALAHGIDREQLPADRVHRAFDVEWSTDQQEVHAWRVDRFEDLDLSRHRVARREADEALRRSMSELLAERARREPEQALGLDREPSSTFLQRVRRLRQWAPELELPSIDEQLDELIEHLAAGRTSYTELRQQPVFDMLRGVWSHQQLTLLDEWVPERIRVPGGRHVAIRYGEDGPPVLAARIQELFGWRQAPRIAGGRQKLLLHLLAPSRRPAQITDDLEGFWRGSYSVVRKDLAGRYPKHDWPENPLDLA